MSELTLPDLKKARQTIDSAINRTPVLNSEEIDEEAGCFLSVRIFSGQARSNFAVPAMLFLIFRMKSRSMVSLLIHPEITDKHWH